MATQKFITSPENGLIWEDIKVWLWTTIRYTGLIFLGALFTALQTGLTFKQAFPIALTAFWGAILDLIETRKKETKYPTS